MAFIRNVDKLIEGLENKFFTEARARAAVAPDIAVEQSRAEAAEFAEQSARQSADSQLQSNIDSEQSARQIADSALSGRLDVVEGSGEGSIKKSLQDAKAYADQKVSDLIDGAPGALDTLKEIADQLGNDESAVGALTNTVASNLSEAKSYADSKVAQEVSDRQLAVSNEQSARQSADSALGLRVDGVQGDLASEVSARQSAMSSEQSARQSADQTLSGRLDTLEQDPTTKSYVDGINSSLDSRLHILEEDPTTKSYVDGVKSNLQNQVSQEISDRQLAVSSEQQRAESAEQALSGRLGVLEQDPTTKNYVDGKVTMLEGEISQEVSDRQSAITQEASARHAEVETEKSRAMLAESGLQSSINQEISDRQSAISSEASTRSSADAAEALARQNADSALDSRVGVLEQDPTTKTYVDGIKSDLQGKIDQEKSDRQSAVTSEASSRQSADSALSLRIGVLEQDPTTKTYVDAQINGLVNGAPGTLDTLKEIADQLASDESVVGALTSTVTSNLQAAKDYADGKVNTEQSRAQAAEAGISSNLSSEISRAQSAESSLNLAISQEVSDRQVAVSAEASARTIEDLTMVKLDGSRIMTGTLKVPTIQGSANEWGGRLFLSSTENGGKSAVQINDGSGFAITTPGLDSTLTSQYYLNGNPTAQVGLLLASEAGKDWDNNAWNFFVGRYGDGAYMAMGGSAGGSLADIRPLNAGETSSTIFFRTVDESGDPGSVGAAKIQIKASENHGNGHFGSYYNFQARKQGASQVNALDVRAEYMQMYGGMVVAQKSVSSDYSVVIGDYLIGVSDLSVTKNITLPDPSEVPAGMTFVIKDMTGSASQTNYINIIPSAGKIDGQNAFALKAAYESVMIISDGTNYYVL